MTRLVVRHHNPSRVAIFVITGLLGSIAAGWGLFEYGRHRAGIDFSTAEVEAERLTEVNEGLEETITGLREQQAVLERSQQIEREAYKQMEGTILGLQEEISELKSELAFYRSIVSPADSPGDLNIQSFDVTGNGFERGYRYKLVLTQVLKNDTVAKGLAGVEIEGTKDGRLVSLNLADLDSDIGNELLYKFRYFENFEGDIQLPSGFAPVRVTVKLDPRDQRYKPVHKVFKWPA